MSSVERCDILLETYARVAILVHHVAALITPHRYVVAQRGLEPRHLISDERTAVERIVQTRRHECPSGTVERKGSLDPRWSSTWWAVGIDHERSARLALIPLP